MTKPNLLSAAMMAAALLLTTPAMARQVQLASQRLVAKARIATTAHSTDPAAVIAPVICVVLGSTMCGATGAPITGQWFALGLEPKITRNTRDGHQHDRSNTFSHRTDLVHQVSAKDKP
jgi:hypothetical protein